MVQKGDVIRKNKIQLHWLVVPLVIAVYLLVVWQVVLQVQQTAINTLRHSGQSQLNLYASHLQGELQRFEKLPALIATHPRLLEVLQDPDDSEAVDGLNRYLEEINRSSGAADIYLMSHNGLTLAASNWNGPRPFVGRNFSFRPYFQQAIQGSLGRYYALGTTSQQRGYYFASAVKAAGEIFGVVVVKVNLSNIEQEWIGLPEEVVVTDPDGVIFIATQPAWRFKSIRPLDDQTRTRIELSRRYPQASLQPLALNFLHDSLKGGILVQLLDMGQRYLMQSQIVTEADWEMHLLSPLLPVREQMVNAFLMISMVTLALLFLGLGLRQRSKRIEERRLYDEQARDALYQAHAELEQRVRERTVDLSESNEQLSREIEDRRHAETQLRRTQDELVQAAKLATLGQMSAGINHELSQPLAAIRTYAGNGKALLEKARYAEVEENLIQISDLTERMARIGAQLKIFSRKSSGQLSAVSVQGVIDGAKAVIGPRSETIDAELEFVVPDRQLKFYGDEVLLQQVLVNLIYNALQAVEGKKEREVEVRVEEKMNDQIALIVEDSGRGIADEHLEKIFDPFFTTKEASEGLGLGLTISNRIITELGGEMSARSGSLGGACFEVILPGVAEEGI